MVLQVNFANPLRGVGVDNQTTTFALGILEYKQSAGA